MNKRYTVLLDMELVARVRALARRTGLDRLGGRIVLGDVLSVALKDWVKLREREFGLGGGK